MYKPILAIDGGGIRGIIPLTVLSYIEQEMGKPISEIFYLISGSSTGGIIALGLMAPQNKVSRKPLYTAHQVLELYESKAHEIFQQTFWGGIMNIFNWSRSLYHVFSCKYSAVGIEKVLETFFGQTLLSQALRPVVIPAYNLSQKGEKGPRTKFFSSHAAEKSEDAEFFKGNYFMKDVARATSAAPLFFPPKEIKKRNTTYCLIDGSLAAHDPSLLACVEAKKLFPDDPMLLVSLGTEMPLIASQSLKNGGGLLSWKNFFSSLLIQPNASSQRLFLKKIWMRPEQLKSFRFCPPQQYRFDDFDDYSAEHIALLKKTAQRLIVTEWANDLKNLIALLKQSGANDRI
jgi:uncharacterized protein